MHTTQGYIGLHGGFLLHREGAVTRTPPLVAIFLTAIFGLLINNGCVFFN